MPSSCLTALKGYFLQLNLFEKEFYRERHTRAQLMSTRIYIVSLVCSLSLVGIASALIVRMVEKTDESPSQVTFEHLMKDYSADLQCPCSQLGIAYRTFTRVEVHLHRVCTSGFVHEKWLAFVNGDDLQRRSSFFWRTIADLCYLSGKAWMDADARFGSSTIFSLLALSIDLLRIDAEIRLARARLGRNLSFI